MIDAICTRLLHLLLLIAVGVSASVSAAEPTGEGEEFEPLPLELPNPVFTQPVRLPDDVLLAPRDAKPREPFMAPADVRNLAKGKRVTASAEPDTGRLALLTDGNKEPLEGRLVDLPDGRQPTRGCAPGFALAPLRDWAGPAGPG